MTTRGGPLGDGYHHRSTLKKPNKPFKGHSKGRQGRINRGKVDSTSTTSSALPPALPHPTRSSPSPHVSAKAVRLLRAKQLQQQRRLEVVQEKRVGSQHGPPRVIGLIPLNPSCDVTAALHLITEGECQHRETSPGVYEVEWQSGGRTKRVVVYLTPRHQHAILDIAKTADLLCFLVSPPTPTTTPIPSTPTPSSAPSSSTVSDSTLSLDASPHLWVDDFGRHAVTLIKAQGLPSTLGLLLPPPPSLSSKAAALYKRTATRFFATAIGEECRVVSMDSGGSAIRRWLVEGRIKPIKWRDSRCHMLGVGVVYEEERRVLRVRGWLRGEKALNVNGLVHITGHGDYQIEKVEGRPPRREEARGSKGSPQPSRRSSSAGEEVMEVEMKEEESKMGEEGDAGVVVLAASTEASRDSLVSLNPVNTPTGEQSLITDEELAEAGAADPMDDDLDALPLPRVKEKRHVPGEADHQRVWDEALGWDEEDPLPSSASARADEGEREVLALKTKLERDEVAYPDEVSVPMGTVYRERFAAYRGLKSMRDSEWDVRVDLPVEYSQIFTFADFKHSRAVAMRDGLHREDTDGWVPSQRHNDVTLSLLDVSPETAAALLKGLTPTVLFSLMSHEHKVSVVHCAMQRQAEYVGPLKGKERVEVHCGFRRFVTSPIYSHYTPPSTGGHHRNRALVERFFHPGRYTTASFYSHIMYQPAPVLMFPVISTLDSTPSTLTPTITPIIATGSLSAVDPDRLLLKRVILTGSAVSCRGREAVVYEMFHSPADVDYFKPVGLWTKKGLSGHILQSHGLHGHMTCEFDRDITQQDTVCMSLYKRQFCPLDATQFGMH